MTAPRKQPAPPVSAKRKAAPKGGGKGKPGRPPGPTKMTPEVVAACVQAMKAGAYIETASSYAGITRETLYEWLRKGAAEEAGPYRDFSDTIKKALADSELRDLSLIAKAANEQWQAAAWRLERRYPERWGRRVIDQRVTVDDMRRRATAAGLDPDEVLAEVAAIAGATDTD